MILHFAVCDDEQTQLDFLSSCLKEWADRSSIPIRISTFSSAESFLFQYAEEKSFHFLLLDIEMKQMNGIELATRIRQDNREIQIIFITGYMEYIASGYDVEALHYLLKPVTFEKLSSVLNRGCERIGQQEKSILLEYKDETLRIPLYEIRYLEVRQNYVTIHGAEDYTVKKTLSQLEQELDDSFFRTGRSFLVNLRYVKKITKKEVLLKDDTSVPLSRGLYEAANRALIRYF